MNEEQKEELEKVRAQIDAMLDSNDMYLESRDEYVFMCSHDDEKVSIRMD